MNLAFAVTIGVLFGTGIFLVLKPDLFRVVAGLLLVSNAAILTLMASGLTRGQAPIKPLSADEPVSDPLVQAMSLTAIVISFATAALLLGLVYGIYCTRHSIDFDELEEAEIRASEEEEREAAHDREEEEEEVGV